VRPHDFLRATDDHLRAMPAVGASEVRVSPRTKLVCKLALHHASRAGHPGVESADLLLALFEETGGAPVSILRQHGADPDVLVSRFAAQIRDLELRNERLNKRFELPPFMKQFGHNLNLLAYELEQGFALSRLRREAVDRGRRRVSAVGHA